MTTSTPTTNGSTEMATNEKEIAVVQKSDPIYALRDAMNRLFDEFSFHPRAPRVHNDFHFGLTLPRMLDEFSGYALKLDVKETAKEYVITAELPGVKPHDVELKIVGDNLILHGEKHAEKEEKESNYYRLERSYGSFQRILPIPVNVDRDAIQATTNHGVLRISLPKDKSAQKEAR